MPEMTMALTRTVFLPKGSPGICTVREIKADIRRYDLVSEYGRVFCAGEADLLIEYLSFAKGEQYPGYEEYEQQIPGGGSMWQALLTLPFELMEEGDIPCPPLSELSVGALKWFMVSPHALEMEMAVRICWQEDGQTAKENTNIKVSLGGERLSMKQDDKVMHLGVSDQGWRLTEEEQKAAMPEEAVMQEAVTTEMVMAETVTEATVMAETVMEETVVEETCMEETVTEEIVVTETVVAETVMEEAVMAETVTEETAMEETVEAKKVIVKFSVEEIMANTAACAETAAAAPAPITETAAVAERQNQGAPPEAPPQPATRRHAAGLPQFQVRQTRQKSIYEVNFRIEEK